MEQENEQNGGLMIIRRKWYQNDEDIKDDDECILSTEATVDHLTQMLGKEFQYSFGKNIFCNNQEKKLSDCGIIPSKNTMMIVNHQGKEEYIGTFDNSAVIAFDVDVNNVDNNCQLVMLPVVQVLCKKTTFEKKLNQNTIEIKNQL
jgi:hypothetical protein